jgi:hypothetical protein
MTGLGKIRVVNVEHGVMVWIICVKGSSVRGNGRGLEMTCSGSTSVGIVVSKPGIGNTVGLGRELVNVALMETVTGQTAAVGIQMTKGAAGLALTVGTLAEWVFVTLIRQWARGRGVARAGGISSGLGPGGRAWSG